MFKKKKIAKKSMNNQTGMREIKTYYAYDYKRFSL